jgi:hypothetical protein
MAISVEHQTNLFCWRRGFKATDLGNHPCADDLVLLSLIKDDLGKHITDRDHAKLNGLWSMVYVKQFPLKNKHHRDLEEITIRAQQAILKQKIQLAKIKRLKRQKSENPGQ